MITAVDDNVIPASRRSRCTGTTDRHFDNQLRTKNIPSMNTRHLPPLLYRLAIGAACLTCSHLTQAQLPTSDLQEIYPPVAAAGSSVEVTVSGENLAGLKHLRFDAPRIKAPPVLRAGDDFYPTRQSVDNHFQVDVPATVEPGIYEVRSLGHFGLSTARPFLVVANDAVEVLEQGDHASRETAAALAIETGLTGKLDSRKADWYKISASKGERLIAQIWAERLDAATDAMLSIYDSEGRELESNREFFGRDPLVDFTAPADGEYFISVADILYRGGQGYFYRLKVSRAPHIDFIDPPAGTPGTTSRFTIYGRNLPGGSPGEGITLDGKPLESIDVDIAVPETAASPTTFTSDTPRAGALPAFDYQLADSNTVRIGFLTAPIVNEDPSMATQKVDPDCEIVGRFDEPGDTDSYRFTAAAGKTYHLEILSELIGALTDPYFRVEKIVVAEDGSESFEQVAESDDPPTYFDPANLDATYLDTLDPGLTLDATGAATSYRITLLNQLGGAGPTHRYRLAIREARPDFLLITTSERNLANGRAGFPAAHLVRQGGSITYRVIAPRRDGFAGEIVVRAGNLPEGVTAKPLRMHGNTDEGFLTVVAAKDAPAWEGKLTITGTAEINGQTVRKTARNAALVWGNIFADSRRVRSRLDKEIVLSVTDRETAPAYVAADAKVNQRFQVHLNDSLKIPVKVTDYGTRKNNLTVQVHGFPGYLKSPPSITIAESEHSGELSINFEPRANFEIKPGRYQFVLQGIGVADYAYHPQHTAHLEAEYQRFIKLARELTSEVAALKQTQTKAQTALDELKANATTATGEQKPAIDKRITEAESAVTDAGNQLRAAETRLKRAGTLRGSFANLAAAAKTKSTAKSTKFATFSQPIDVEVLPAKENAVK